MSISTQKNRGFTLIETLAVTAIIGIIVTILFINQRDFIQKSELRAAMTQLINTIEEVKSKNNASITPADIAANGFFPSFGVQFTVGHGSVTIFADCIPDDNDDGLVRVGDDFQYNSSTTECSGANGDLIKNVELINNTVIKEIITDDLAFPTGTTAPSTITTLDILYLKPEPTVWYTLNSNNSLVTSLGKATIVIENSAGDTRSITLSSNAQVYEEK